MTRPGSQSPNEARSAKTKTLRDITNGNVLAFSRREFLEPWGAEKWACEQVAINFDTDPDDDIVECEDTDEGRFYSINGKPVAYIEGEYEPLWVNFAEAAE